MKSEKKLTLNDIEEVFSERKAGAEDGFKFFLCLGAACRKRGWTSSSI